MVAQVTAKLSLTAKASFITAGLIAVFTTALSTAILTNLRGSVGEIALEQQSTSLRTAADVFEEALPDLIVRRDASGNIDRLTLSEMPAFNDHGIIDRIGRMTGETATIFAWEDDSQDFWRRSTNIRKDDGSRAIGTPLGAGAVYDAMRDGETFLGSATILGKDYYTLYEPILDTSGAVHGILYVGIEKQNFDQIFEQVTRQITMVALICGILGIAATMLAFRRLLKPIPVLTDVMRRLAENDHSIDVPFRGRADEIGTIAEAVEVFRQNGEEKVRLEAEAEQSKLRAEEEKRQEMHRLADEFEASCGDLMTGIATVAQELTASADSLADQVDRSSEDSASVAAAADQASVNVESVAASATELSATIAEVSRSVSQSAGSAKKSADNAAENEKELDTLNTALEDADAIITQISDIAEQTNLLALNATIEAARAGEAGKGFAVVANEVKTLASQTKSMTQSIGDSLSAVRSSADNAIKGMRRIIAEVRDISEVTTDLAGAVEEQGQATQEISQNANQASDGTTSVSQAMQNVRDANMKARESTEQVRGSALKLDQQAVDMKARVDDFLRAVRAG